MKNILEISGIGDSCEDNLSLCRSFSNDADRLAEMLCQSFDDIKTVSAAMLEKKRVICRIYNEVCQHFAKFAKLSRNLFLYFLVFTCHYN